MLRIPTVRAIAALALAIASASAAPAFAAGSRGQPDNPFALPQFAAEQQLLQMQLQQLIMQQDMAQAERVLKAAIERNPSVGANYYNLACILARQGHGDQALSHLQRAVATGFADAGSLVRDPDLDAVRKEPGFAAVLSEAEETARRAATEESRFAIVPIRDGVAAVTESNVIWEGLSGVFRCGFSLPPAPPPAELGIRAPGQAGDLVRGWLRGGTAGGLYGVLYDNHDDGHSALAVGDFPGLTRIRYAPAVSQARLASGLQVAFLYNLPTLGNSSTAMTEGPFWRSLPRLALINPSMAAMLYNQYANNHLYVYPTHRDIDDDHGDTFAANTPYVVACAGSSGADQAFLRALACTIAAFPAETRRALTLSGTLAPTLQMILRSTARTLAKPADYLTGAAHPTALDGAALDVDRMVTVAHEMAPDALPPSIHLRVVQEDTGVPGIDFFDVPNRERLFDSPSAIARLFRSVKYQRRMVVTAEGSRDLNARPLTYRWAVLRGNPETVRIKPLNPAGSMVEITVAWHEPRPIQAGSKVTSPRVDIGAFVHNGVHYSAPAFVSFFCYPNEKRTYAEDHRIRSVEYRTPKAGVPYVDPAIDLPKDWRDDYRYDGAGRLIGWTRARVTETEEFTSDGALVMTKDRLGRPLKARVVQYAGTPAAPGVAPTLRQLPTDMVLRYAYRSDADRVGYITGRITPGSPDAPAAP